MPRTLHLRPRFGASLLALLLLARPAAAVDAPTVEVDDPYEAKAHLVGDPPVVRTPWVDRTFKDTSHDWVFRLTVDAGGAVTHATPSFGPVKGRDRALRLVQALKFRPFVQDGVPVPARFDLLVRSEPEDYVGPAARTFPPAIDPKHVRIALRRTRCFGTCPGYRVEIRGDGRVSYRGVHDVAVEGEHHWQVPPAAVAALVEQFRQADYFQLAGEYVVDVTDLPTYVTRLSLDTQHKTVLDYGGAEESRLIDPSGAPPAKVSMPAAVTALEDAIDATAGTATWVQGDERTLDALRAARWNFRTPAAARGLLHLIQGCQIDLAVGFLQAGAPVRVRTADSRDEPLAAATRCGSQRLIRALAAHGALATRSQAQALLAAAAGRGYPELVRLAVARGADPRQPSRDDGLPLITAAREPFQDEDLKPDMAFDPVGVVRTLLAAGARVDARDANGATALHHAGSAPIAQALLAAGADPNARDQRGRTPLFNEFFAEVKPLLLAAGADVAARDHVGRTALFGLRSPDVAQALLQSGADVNAHDKAGDTPLDSAESEEVALVLLDAGAAWPATPERRAALIERATAQKWVTLLARLTPAEAVTAPR